MLKTAPAVFAVGREYQIMVPVTEPSLMWVRVGETCYYDESNGVMRSLSPIHRMKVPMEELNRFGRYTVCERRIRDRKPYRPEIDDAIETEYLFSPLPSTCVRAYHIADAHNRVEEPVRAALAFGSIDLLILNGDIPNHSGDIQYFDAIYEIAAKLTNGRIPVIFSRGNHDMRGLFAEQIADYTPNQDGKSYFTFRLGEMWGLVLDCGEDKDDTNVEYGGTVCCHAFRQRQTDFIKDVIDHAESEYLADGVQHRVVIVHNPFTKVLRKPFDIERNLYSYWATLLKNYIKPDIMICGHLHETFVSEIGSKHDDLGQPCPVVVGAKPKDGYFEGAGFTFYPDHIEVQFTDSDGKSKKPYTITI